jgi:hypothetical protein
MRIERTVTIDRKRVDPADEPRALYKLRSEDGKTGTIRAMLGSDEQPIPLEVFEEAIAALRGKP